MMKLKPTYDKNGRLLMNREDENGRLWVFCKDNKEKLIIRDFFEDDAVPWVNTMLADKKLNAKQKNACVEKLKETIRKRQEDDLEFSLLVTTHTGKIIGGLDVYPGKEAPYVEAEVTLLLKSEFAIQQKGESLIRAVWNLHKNYGWYDKVYIRNEKGEISELQLEVMEV